MIVDRFVTGFLFQSLLIISLGGIGLDGGCQKRLFTCRSIIYLSPIQKVENENVKKQSLYWLI